MALAGLRDDVLARIRPSRRFSPARWEADYRRTVDGAFRQVTYYREQWAVAGRVLDEPTAVTSAELAGEAFRLCPLDRPWRPGAEPPLWIDGPEALRDALMLASDLPPPLVLEVRAALVDWTTLGRGGPRYAVVLPPAAVTLDRRRRDRLNRRAVTSLAAAGRALLVGSAAETAEVVPELEVGTAELRTVRRATPAEAIATEDPVLVHDPCLGYFAARRPSCGGLHVLWRRFHLSVDADGVPAVTALRRTRPTLVRVIPAGHGHVSVEPCSAHGTPVLTARPG